MSDVTARRRLPWRPALATATCLTLIAAPAGAFAAEPDSSSTWTASLQTLDSGVRSGYQLALDGQNGKVYVADAQWRAERKVVGTPENTPFSFDGVTSNSQTSMRTTFSPYGVAVDPDVDGEAVIVTTTARQQAPGVGYGGGVVVYKASQGAPTDADRLFEFEDGTPVLAGPRRIAIHDGTDRAFVTSLGNSRGQGPDGFITVLDLTKRGAESVLARITVPDAAGSVGVTVDEANNLIYVGAYAERGEDSKLYVIDGNAIDTSDGQDLTLNNGAIRALDATVGGNARPTYNAELQRVYVSAYDLSIITVVDADPTADTYGQVIDTIEVTTDVEGAQRGTNAVEIDGERGLLYSANLDGGVSVYDINNDHEQIWFTAADGTTYRDIPTSGRSVNLGIDPATGNVWASTWSSNGTVDIIDIISRATGAEYTTRSTLQDSNATITYPTEWVVGEPLVVTGSGWTSKSGVGSRVAVKLDANGTQRAEILDDPEVPDASVWQVFNAKDDGTFEITIDPFPTAENSWTSPATPAWEAGTTHTLAFLTGSLGAGTPQESVARGGTHPVTLVAESSADELAWSADVTTRETGVRSGYQLALDGQNGKAYIADAQWASATRDAETGEVTQNPGTGKIVEFDVASGELVRNHDFTQLRRNDGIAQGELTTAPTGKVAVFDVASQTREADHDFTDLTRVDGSGKDSDPFVWTAESPNNQTSMRTTFSPYGVAVDPDVDGEAVIVTTTARQQAPGVGYGGGVVVYKASQGAPTDADRLFEFEDGTPVLAGPRRIAIHDGTDRAFVTSLGNSRGQGPDGFITVLDLTKRGAESVLARITVPDAAGSVGVTVDEANNLIYVGAYAERGEDSKLYVIDGNAIDTSDGQDLTLNNGAIRALDATVGGNARPTYNAELQRVYVSAYDLSIITVVDADPTADTYGQVIDTIEVTTDVEGAQRGTNAVEIDGERGLLYSANLDGGVSVYDINNDHEQIWFTAADGTTYRDIPTSGRSVNLGIDPATGNVWASTWSSNGTVDIIDITESAAPTVSAPSSITVDTGEVATFETTVTGSPAPTLQWQSKASGGDWSDIAGETGETLQVTAERALDGIQYRVVATNEHGTAESAPATLSVEYAPVVTAAPLSTTVDAGGTATFSAAAEGKPAATVVWQVKKGDADWAVIEGATSTTLTVSDVARADRGNQYRAVFVNRLGEVATAAATLGVDVPRPGTPAWRDDVPADTEALLAEDAGDLTAVQTGTTVTIGNIPVEDDEWVQVFGYTPASYLGAYLVTGGTTTVDVSAFEPGDHHLAVFDTEGELLGHVPFTIAAGTDTSPTPDTPTGSKVLPTTGGELPLGLLAGGGLLVLLGGALVALRAVRSRATA